jgi:hypothetical protein
MLVLVAQDMKVNNGRSTGLAVKVQANTAVAKHVKESGFAP